MAADRLVTADALSEFAVEYRYPGDAVAVLKDQAEEASRVAKGARETVLMALKSYLDRGRPLGTA